MQFPNVTAEAVANVYFGGKVVSHTIITADGARKTLGIIHPGSYHFDTKEAERMEITAGTCEVLRDGTTTVNFHQAGDHFDVPAASGFSITVKDGLCQYVCSFLP